MEMRKMFCLQMFGIAFARLVWNTGRIRRGVRYAPLSKQIAMNRRIGMVSALALTVMSAGVSLRADEHCKEINRIRKAQEVFPELM
jgi:hypothetical protein